MAGKFRKAFLPGGWLGAEVRDLKNSNQTIISFLKGLFVRQAPARQESFEQAIIRLNVSEEEIKELANKYRWYAMFFFMLAVLLLLYSFYLLFEYFTIMGCLLALAACAFTLSYAFRFDFWAYQMRVRKLGVSYKEWKQSILGTKGTPT